MAKYCVNKVPDDFTIKKEGVITVPNNALTPRQILERFTSTNGVLGVNQLEGINDVVDETSDAEFDNSPADLNIPDFEFEDDFERQDFLNWMKQDGGREFKIYLKQIKKIKENADNDSNNVNGNDFGNPDTDAANSSNPESVAETPTAREAE